MKRDKIMAGGNLENIVTRLVHCGAVLNVLCADLDGGNVCPEAFAGVCDLLDGISRDFHADIDGAEDYTEALQRPLVLPGQRVPYLT